MPSGTAPPAIADDRLLELVRGADSVELVAAEMREYLAQQGIELSGEQETKTRRALELFSARLKTHADDRHARNYGTRSQEETP